MSAPNSGYGQPSLKAAGFAVELMMEAGHTGAFTACSLDVYLPNAVIAVDALLAILITTCQGR